LVLKEETEVERLLLRELLKRFLCAADPIQGDFSPMFCMGKTSSLSAAFLFMLLLICSPLQIFGEELDEFSLSGTAAEIELSSFDDLRMWSARLGLNTIGEREDLADRLYEYYGIDRLEQSIEEGEETIALELLYADYLKTGEAIRLTGDVRLNISDAESGSVQKLTADSVVINSETGRIAAIGNVHIEQDLGGEVQSLEAESFIITTEGKQGVFLSAISRMDRTGSENQSIEFYLTGSVLIRDGETLLLESSFMSSDLEHAYYSLTADTMRILPKGDWFLTHGVLHIGRVPVFYMPFFFYPAHRFFFNPSFGFDSQRGMFLNTTTYLFGYRKPVEPDQESTFSSFLSMRQQDESDFTQRQGMLTAYTDQAPSALQQWARDSNSFAALYLDAYRNDGVYLSIDTEINDLSIIDEFTLLSGITADTQQVRYAAMPELSLRAGDVKATIRTPWYSDPYIYQELTSRNTSFDMNALFGGYRFDTQNSPRNDITWDITGSGSFEIAESGSVLERIDIRTLRSTARWDNYDEVLSAYELDTVTYADARVSISGTLLDYTNTNQEIESEPESTGVQHVKLNQPEFFSAAEVHEYEKLNPMPSTPLGSSFFTDEKPAGKPLGFSLTYDVTGQYNHRSYVSEEYEKISQRVSPNIYASVDLPQLGMSVSNAIKPVISGSWDRDGNGEFTPDKQESTVLNDLKVSFAFASIEYQNRYYFLHDDLSQPLVRHTISASQDIPLVEGTFIASVESTLPPLDVRVSPALRYSWDIYSLMVSPAFEQVNGDGFTFTQTKLQASAVYAASDYLRLKTLFDHQDELRSKSTVTSSYAPFEKLFLKQEAVFLHKQAVFERGSLSFGYDDALLRLNFEQDPARSDDAWARFAGWEIDSGKLAMERSYWKKRIGLSLSADAEWHQNLLDVYDNELKVAFTLGFSIEEFLDLTVTSVSRNTNMSSYFSSTGERENLFLDLLKSFNFFNETDRRQSDFNLDSIQIGIVHYMKDWDLNAKISGNVGYDGEQWRWMPKVSVYLRWKAISELDFEAALSQEGVLELQ
jgi:hypothetical protein